MSQENETIDRIKAEAANLEDDALHTYKAHFNATSVWTGVHYVLGVGVVVLSTLAAKSGLPDTATLSLCAAVIAAVMTFLNPAKLGAVHKAAGCDFQDLRNQAHLLHAVEADAASGEELSTTLKDLRKRQVELGRKHPVVPRWAYWMAKRGIAAGEAKHEPRNV